jgi:hypothetical protein
MNDIYVHGVFHVQHKIMYDVPFMRNFKICVDVHDKWRVHLSGIDLIFCSPIKFPYTFVPNLS